MSQQMELFADSPFSLRLTIEEAFRIFWDNYWCHVVFAQKSKPHIRRIKLFFKDFYIDAISKTDVERFCRWSGEMGYSVSTTNKSHMVLGRLYSKLAEFKEGQWVNGVDFSRIVLPIRNPAALVRRPSESPYARKMVATPEAFRRLLSYATDSMMDELILLADTGQRRCDLRRLTSNNVDLPRHALRGTQSKHVTNANPSGTEYAVRMTERVERIVVARMDGTKPGTPLFRFTNWDKRWNTLRTITNTRHIQARDLRRTKGTFFADNGADDRTTMNALGLKTPRLLDTYAPRDLIHQRPILDKFEKTYAVPREPEEALS